MNEKQLRSYIKKYGIAKVYIFQEKGHNVITTTVFRLEDIKSRHLHKTLEYYKAHHGELRFELVI
ncbi:TPA: hypothetical protein QCY70_004930 [Bacillus cereus]|uniref:hypothetical protein n=1 Tax=Bacillus paranthracis TaxID=2026186 RepID=UPI0032F6BE10|nr:hypothetical protein [Bacillus cereus]HDR8014962.1 hypothetical protein [Bacillus cereus]